MTCGLSRNTPLRIETSETDVAFRRCFPKPLLKAAAGERGVNFFSRTFFANVFKGLLAGHSPNLSRLIAC